MSALASVSVGVVVRRYTATSPWLDYVWKPVSILEGVPSTPAWTTLRSVGSMTEYYAGSASIDFYRTETDNYLSNLASGNPVLWIVLRPTGLSPPYDVTAVTADPAEGEAFTEAGNDIVETVPMPLAIAERLEAFVAEHDIRCGMDLRHAVDQGSVQVKEDGFNVAEHHSLRVACR